MKKLSAGAAIHTNLLIAHTRRCAQFSLGEANLIRPAKLASGFLKKFVTIARRKRLYFHAV
jgi:hypothetical protein